MTDSPSSNLANCTTQQLRQMLRLEKDPDRQSRLAEELTLRRSSELLGTTIGNDAKVDGSSAQPKPIKTDRHSASTPEEAEGVDEGSSIPGYLGSMLIKLAMVGAIGWLLRSCS
jgi:hypothetical protein